MPPQDSQKQPEGWRTALQTALLGSQGLETEAVPWHGFVLRALLRALPTAWVGLALTSSSTPMDLLLALLGCLLLGWGLQLFQMASSAVSLPSLCLGVILVVASGSAALDLWWRLQAGAAIDPGQPLATALGAAALMGGLLVLDGPRRARAPFPVACALWLLLGLALGVSSGERLLGWVLGLGVPLCLTLGEWAERWALGGDPTRRTARRRGRWLWALLLGLLWTPCMPSADFVPDWTALVQDAPRGRLADLWRAQQGYQNVQGRPAHDLAELFSQGFASPQVFGAPIRGYRFEVRNGVCLAVGPELLLAKDAAGSERWLPALPGGLAARLFGDPRLWPAVAGVPARPGALHDWAAEAGQEDLADWAWWQACRLWVLGLGWQALLALLAGSLCGLGWTMTDQLQADSSGPRGDATQPTGSSVEPLETGSSTTPAGS